MPLLLLTFCLLLIEKKYFFCFSFRCKSIIIPDLFFSSFFSPLLLLLKKTSFFDIYIFFLFYSGMNGVDFIKTDDCKNANIARHTQRPMFFIKKKKTSLSFSFSKYSLHSISLLGLSLPIFSHKLTEWIVNATSKAMAERNDLLKFI